MFLIFVQIHFRFLALCFSYLQEHLDFLQSANTTLWVSGMSAKARGYNENLLEGFNAQFAMPNRLVEASLEADTVLCY